MIIESTYILNKETKELINDIVGKPYNFIDSFKMKGVGSKRMIIEETSPNLFKYLNQFSGLNYANIELRSKGILIFLNKGFKNFIWTIPFYQLVIDVINSSSIHAQGKYILFRNNETFIENKTFFNKLLKEKLKFNKQYNFKPKEKKRP